MLAAPSHPPAHPFFLEAAPGRRFCLYHRPHAEPRGAVLLAPAFAEEMNKSRRMCALQARSLAQQGYGVLQVDPYGCGDSDGDFGDARWDIWKSDLETAIAWLRRECPGPLWLWGVRLGALLALDVAADDIAGMLLWQPVTSGESWLTAFLRLRLAADMLTGEGKEGGTRGLRAELTAGAALEVAGYRLAPELAAAIDMLDVAQLAAPPFPVHWFEMQPQAGRALPTGRARLAQACVHAGWRLNTHLVEGPAFWASQEIAEAPALIAATLEAMEAGAP